jgi:hypothetical protein
MESTSCPIFGSASAAAGWFGRVGGGGGEGDDGCFPGAACAVARHREIGGLHPDVSAARPGRERARNGAAAQRLCVGKDFAFSPLCWF